MDPNFILEHNKVLQLILSFWFGVLTTLTPCVYPLIPVVVSLFSKCTSRVFFAPIVYCLGIAITYTTLGIVAVKLGFLFGSLLGNPYIYIPVFLAIVYLSLWNLDLVQLPGLSKFQQLIYKIDTGSNHSLKGFFISGLLSGFIAAPCTGPALAIILEVAASSNNLLWGGILLFSYSLGFSTLYLILG